ncbi:MAG: ABC transporter ATP-binding protein [Candidatus Aminicenantes bacterium]|nr:ABC transporter ATP-binding protein [Candidatus Aminicenantes bacterium]
MTTPAPAVETRGLTKLYGDVRAVDGLDLRVEQGEMFSLVGPDGAGKTTAIRILCGILKPSGGRVTVLGRDMSREGAAVKSRIGYLSQRFSLYGDLTVDENIEFFAEIHGVEDFRTRREDLLAFTRLTPFRNRLAERLSGGMKQKLALACTLVHRPSLLLLDEPTTGVDPVSRRDFWKILSSLLKTGMTILLTTPYLDEAERSSRVGLMSEGNLKAVGPPRKIQGLMKGHILEIAPSDVRKAYRALLPLKAPNEIQMFGDRLHIVVADPDRERPALTGALRREGVDIFDWQVVPPSLENVFIQLTLPPGTEARHD